MIRFTRQPEPAAWDARCRTRGRNWLQQHPDYERPKDYWREFEPCLRTAFNGMCAFCAMFVFKANMDHFVPVKVLRLQGRHELAYEWSNFRYVEGDLNQRKGTHSVLDPFEVRDYWFKIILPSLQLVLTERVPRTRRAMAEFTIKRLGLQDGEVVIRYRQQWFEMYQTGRLDLAGLEQVAPQIARAVRADLEIGKDWRY